MGGEEMGLGLDAFLAPNVLAAPRQPHLQESRPLLGLPGEGLGRGRRSGHEGRLGTQPLWAGLAGSLPTLLLSEARQGGKPQGAAPLRGDWHGLRPAARLDSMPSWLAVASWCWEQRGHSVRCHPSGVVGGDCRHQWPGALPPAPVPREEGGIFPCPVLLPPHLPTAHP